MGHDLQATIPQDWQPTDDAKYCRISFCFPESKEWRATIMGLIGSLSRGRYWRSDGPRKADSPDAIEIRDAQAIGRLIEESICMKCSEFLEEELHQRKLTNTLLKHLVAAQTEGRILHDEGYADPQRDYDPVSNPSPPEIRLRDIDMHSVWRANNWLFPEESITDTLNATLHQGLIHGGADIPIPFEGRGLADLHEQLMVATKHLNAKFSRLNEVPATLTEDGALQSGNQTPSIGTYNRVQIGAEQEWLASILVESLRAGVVPTGLMGLSGVGGSYGIGIADLLKEDEPLDPANGWYFPGGGFNFLGINFGLPEGHIFYKNKLILFRDLATGDVTQIYPPDISAPEGRSITEKLKDFFSLPDGDPYNYEPGANNFIQVLSHATITPLGKSWLGQIYGAVDYLKCICEELGLIRAGDPATDEPPAVDLTNIEAGLENISQALNNLDLAGKRDAELIEGAMGRLADEMQIVAIANAGDNALISMGGDCGCGGSATGSATPTGTGTAEGLEDVYLPTLTKGPVAENVPGEDCYPTGTNYFMIYLDELISWIDFAEDTLGPDVAGMLAPIVIVGVAGSSTAVAGALAGLNLITFPDPSDTATIGATALGSYITYILIQIFADFGLEGIKLILGWVRSDYDVWKALECGETSIDIDLIPEFLAKRLFDYLKGAGHASDLAGAMKGYFEKIAEGLKPVIWAKDKIELGKSYLQ